VVLLELFTRRPAGSETAREVEEATDDGRLSAGLHAWRDEAAPLPDAVQAQVFAVINDCLQRRPERRPRSMRAVLASLTQIRRALVDQAPPDQAPSVQDLSEQIRRLEEQRRVLVEAGYEGGPTEECLMCFERVPEEEGLRCRGAAELGFGHFTCDGCLEGYVKSELAANRRERNRGAFRCPCVDMDVYSCCTAEPWTVEQLAPHLTEQGKSSLIKALQEVVQVQMHEKDAEKVEREKAEREREAVARVTVQEEKVKRYSNLILEDCIFLKCPRCRVVYDDYDACDAVQCTQCGAHFCGLCQAGEHSLRFHSNTTCRSDPRLLCPAVCRDGPSAHAHVTRMNHLNNGGDLFSNEAQKNAWHSGRRRAAVTDAINALQEPLDLKLKVSRRDRVRLLVLSTWPSSGWCRLARTGAGGSARGPDQSSRSPGGRGAKSEGLDVGNVMSRKQGDTVWEVRRICSRIPIRWTWWLGGRGET
jgi:hypothetical protein